MFIEKSPHHPNNQRSQINPNLKDGIKSNKINKPENDTFSFLKWIKGTVNPLQNLPIISGIYSSINSAEKESDRDMVQNSLGGFLYGGPIGAIAGFGNWVFNKVFDKTPTELFFDVTGISNIWENKEKKPKSMAQLNKQNKLISEIKAEGVAPPIIKEVKSKIDIIKPTNEITTSKNNDSIKSKEETGMIEFDYPKWRPHQELEIKKNSRSLNLSLINQQYKVQKNIVSSLNIKA